LSDVLIDSCVVLDLTDPDGAWFEWSASTLETLDAGTTFLIDPVVYAEVSVGFERVEAVEALFARLDMVYRETPRAAGFLAGKAFLQYRRSGGTRTGVLPDFLIGAHAAVSGYRLMTRDTRRFATHFPTVVLISPTGQGRDRPG